MVTDLPQGREVFGISPKLANIFNSEHAEDVPNDLIGATILRIGAPINVKVEGGGLAIEYILYQSIEPEVIVFAFTELGMWISY